ncbi:MAG: hypothetical protein U1B77_00380 [Dehalococcoidales bacterium]|nr:hypothetical protein [Dehalococcoidales bacterium]
MATKQVVVRETGEIIEVPEGAQLTSRAIEDIAENMRLCEKLVATVLEDTIDYGQTPGTQGKGLWDPGASKIIRAFRLHTEHHVIFHEESDELVSWTIEARLVDNAGHIAGTGLGAASTRETKYKYRWVPKPEEFGYAKEQVDDLKTKVGYGGVTLYRIENPEYGELVHTLLAMAAKRSECDAAKSLPGVGSALRKLFDKKQTAPPRKEPDWAGFWGRIAQMGLAEPDVHSMLEVKSIKEWLDKGKDLDEAIKTLAQKMADRSAAAGARGQTASAGTVGAPGGAPDDVLATKDELNALGTRIMAKKGFSQPETVMKYIESVTHKVELWTRADLEKVKKDAGLT